MSKSTFVTNQDELLDSLFEFNQKSEFWKAILGGGAKYFVHLKYNGEHIFGLSKFCVFHNISAAKYIGKGVRHTTNGTTAQRYISKLLNKKWQEIDSMPITIQEAFTDWIDSFYPNFDTGKAFFITLSNNKKIKKSTNKCVTPEDLEKMLAQRKLIGEIGEDIAYDYELDRLYKLGRKYQIYHTSKKNCSSGYDIYSYTRTEERFIEVKTTTKENKELFLTENELNTLKELGKSAYIYLVQITDIESKKGFVCQEIQDPINSFIKENLLIPIAYKVKIGEKE